MGWGCLGFEDFVIEVEGFQEPSGVYKVEKGLQDRRFLDFQKWNYGGFNTQKFLRGLEMGKLTFQTERAEISVQDKKTEMG